MNRRGATLTGPLGGSGMVGLWGASSLIRVQRGIITTGANASATATISEVNPANSLVVYTGTENGGVDQRDIMGWVTLTNGTTVTGARGAANANGTNVTWQVLEFPPGVIKSIQTGHVSFLSSSAPTATITAVNTDRSVLLMRGTATAGADAPAPLSYYGAAARLTLTNATTVTGNQQASGTDVRGYFTVVEFF